MALGIPTSNILQPGNISLTGGVTRQLVSDLQLLTPQYYKNYVEKYGSEDFTWWLSTYAGMEEVKNRDYFWHIFLLFNWFWSEVPSSRCDKCNKRGVPPDKFALDSSGEGGGLADILTREWGVVHRVEFGGSPFVASIAQCAQTFGRWSNQHLLQSCVSELPHPILIG